MLPSTARCRSAADGVRTQVRAHRHGPRRFRGVPGRQARAREMGADRRARGQVDGGRALEPSSAPPEHQFALTQRFTDRGSPCRTYTETFWLKERFLRLAVFPDVMVHCGPVDRDTT